MIRNMVWYIMLFWFKGEKRKKMYLDFLFIFCVIQIIEFINILSLYHLEGMSSDLKSNFLKNLYQSHSALC